MKTDKQKSRFMYRLDFISSVVLLVLLALVAFWRELSGKGGPLLLAAALAVCLTVTIVVKLLVKRSLNDVVHFYEGVLDTIPFMIHTTDMDMKWFFMNKSTMDFLGLKRDDVVGKSCNNWNAAICDTERCSAYCLRQGNPTTFFRQNGLDLRVDTNWLLDRQGKRMGYVEVVQDISKMVSFQRRSELVEELRGACSSLIEASAEIDNGAQMLANGSMEQASSVEELITAFNEVLHVLDQNVAQAEEAAQLSETIRADAQSGSAHINKMLRAVKEITEASRMIKTVMKTIDDIAFQTNMLALNAAVEAARAGIHGKGFAVVADEVRTLAAKSAEAARETGALIENSMEKTELGARISSDTAAALEKIIGGVEQSSALIDGIAQSSREYYDATRRIHQSIQQVSAVVQHNSANAQQSASASHEMSSQARTLQYLLDSIEADESHPRIHTDARA